ncbi:hypothetical protein [Crocosphaera sp.]|uniref:hypothetical protein n=1 Tax=Crocosphaera sp. TaxID=2729996 RepID=UPI003F20E05E|nr:ribbon-helix-helix domain-containing protein [Crocosphaera sp.]
MLAKSPGGMEVTSIRLEKTLKDALKKLAGEQGYQGLIRQLLSDYIEQKESNSSTRISDSGIRATVEVVARKNEVCVLTGKAIQPGQPMLLGFTVYGDFVSLSLCALESS